MLMRAPPNGPTQPHAPRRARQLWHDEKRNPPALGCRGCPEQALCGGVCVEAPYFNCLTYCCGKPGTCGSVCRANPDFADRILEVREFTLANVPRGFRLEAPVLPQAIPVIYHASSRTGLATPGFVALSLCTMFSRRTGSTRFVTGEGLRNGYRLAPETQLLITGIGEDAAIERWWELGITARAQLLRTLCAAGVGLMTTPNYSVTVNAPRWDDLYAIKRIGLIYAEMIGEGMPTALHVNGRTDRDFKRWAEFIAARDEVTHVAYEFTTGTGWPTRLDQHADWLCDLARDVGRPLHLVIRGAADLAGRFATVFAGVTVLETDSFIWAMKRRQAVLTGALSVRPRPAPTERGAPLDDLLAGNILTNRTHIENLIKAGIRSGDASRA
jgi:hypothetical protein